MNELRILEEIRDEFVGKFENDPQVKRICNVMINEFKARKKALTLTDVVKSFYCWDEQALGKERRCQEECETCASVRKEK